METDRKEVLTSRLRAHYRHNVKIMPEKLHELYGIYRQALIDIDLGANVSFCYNYAKTRFHEITMEET